MKIEIITIHRLNNFGSAFQAMALYEYIRSMGYEVELLDYHPDYYKGKHIKNYIGRMLFFKDLRIREKKFDTFIERYTNLSEKRYKTLKEVEKDCPEADLYIAGGDQLWNYHHICGNDDVYKLVFFNGRKISYGTSMGGNRFTKKQLCDLKAKVKTFESISLREKSSIDLFGKMKLKATWVVDPVLLFPKEFYEKMAVVPKETKYVFIYLVSPSPELDKIVQYISEKLHLMVIVYAGFAPKCKCDEQKRDLGPEEVIGYIKNAEYVLSASFHATLFSIIFRKKFAVMLPDENTNERIYDLLNWTKLENKLVKTYEDFCRTYDEDISYEEQEKLIAKRVLESKEYLRKSIEGKI